MLLLTSCTGKKISAQSVANEVLEQNAIPYAKRYVYSAADYTDRYLDEGLSKLLYGCNIYDHCSDFAVALCKKDLVSELHILVAKSIEKADHLKKRLEERVDTLRDKEIYLYDSENAESINAMIYQKGLYVCLSVGQNSEIMYEKLCNILN